MAGRERISSGGPWEDIIGYSRAVKVGDTIWVSGCTGTMPDGAVATGIVAQAARALEVAGGALQRGGATLADAVMVRVYLADFAEFESIYPVLREHFGTSKPALTAVQVAALISPEQRIEIEIQAVAGSGD
jgi:enamine deaminase RidA (YjgF/YER057c/UK114 family)